MIWLQLSTLFTAYAGLSCLALAMDKHHKQVLPGRRWKAGRAGLVRLVGWFCVLVSLTACVIGLGPGAGLPLWFGILSLAALLLILQLAYAPMQARYVVLLSLSLGLSGLVLQ
ncbi:MAG: DUF3325 domain-containing protein [Pseudomonas sp.]